MDSNRIKAIGNDIDEPRMQEILTRIASIHSLAFPAVCLPDSHMKERVEAPCSFVAATNGTIVPELTAPSVGCGMGVVATSIRKEDITPEFYEAVYKHLRAELGPKYGFWKNLFLWLGIIERPKNKYDFSREELRDVITYGSQAILKKYNLSPETSSHV